MWVFFGFSAVLTAVLTIASIFINGITLWNRK